MSFKLKPARVGIVGGALALPALAMAAVPESFTTAVTGVTADAATMAGALVGIAAAVVAVMIALKFVKRIRGAV